MSDPANDQAVYFLRSKRLGFRSLSEDDLPLAIGLWGDPEVTKFIDSRPKLSDHDVKHLLEKQIAIERNHGVQYWPIFLLKDSGHAGCCGVRPYDLPQRIYELGVHIRSSYWRRGLAEEDAST